MYLRIALILVTLIFLYSCLSDPDLNPSLTTDSEDNVAFALPRAKNLAELPKEGSWNAFINISGARNLTCNTPVDTDTCALSIDIAAEKASTRINLEAGTYSLQIEWNFLDLRFTNSARTDGRWSIASAQKSVTVVAGQTASLSFSPNDYQPLPDTDGDKVSNLAELEQGSDPGNPDDPPAPTVAIPNVVGLFETEARSQIETLGLVVGSAVRQFSPTVDKDRVISQDPAAGGDLVNRGTAVNLVISDGPPPVNPKPIAKIEGPKQINATVGKTVKLDGSKSADPKGESISHLWSFQSKATSDSEAKLVNKTAPKASFIPDKKGTYIVQLVVTDASGQKSDPAIVAINAQLNSKPTAKIVGPGQTVAPTQINATVNEPIQLDSQVTNEPQGEGVTYKWDIESSTPPEVRDQAVFDPTTANIKNPKFKATSEGTYRVRLVVTDASGQKGEPAKVTITVKSPEPTVPTIRSQGSLTIKQTFLADLDEGLVPVSGGNLTGMDIWFQAVTAVERFLTPRVSTVALARVGTSSVGFEGCSNAALSSTRIPIADLPEGTFVCVRTDQGRFSEFRVTATVGPSPGTLSIDYTTWETP